MSTFKSIKARNGFTVMEHAASGSRKVGHLSAKTGVLHMTTMTSAPRDLTLAKAVNDAGLDPSEVKDAMRTLRQAATKYNDQPKAVKAGKIVKIAAPKAKPVEIVETEQEAQKRVYLTVRDAAREAGMDDKAAYFAARDAKNDYYGGMTPDAAIAKALAKLAD